MHGMFLPSRPKSGFEKTITCNPKDMSKYLLPLRPKLGFAMTITCNVKDMQMCLLPFAFEIRV